MNNIYHSTIFFILTVLKRYDVNYMLDEKFNDTFTTIIHYKLINEKKVKIKRTLTLDQIDDNTIAINGVHYKYDDLTIGFIVRIL